MLVENDNLACDQGVSCSTVAWLGLSLGNLRRLHDQVVQFEEDHHTRNTPHKYHGAQVHLKSTIHNRDTATSKRTSPGFLEALIDRLLGPVSFFAFFTIKSNWLIYLR